MTATVGGVTNSAAVFTASGQAAGGLSQTRVIGVVLDNANRPMSNILCRIENTLLVTVTDTQGQFVLSNAPVGAVRLNVDARSRGYPGTWHSLQFDLVTVAGRDNSVDRPIYMLPLDAANSAIAGGAADVTLQLAGVPGSSMTIFARSLRDNNNQPITNTVMWTQVNLERVPMAPPIGSQFTLAWTVQPINLRFNPPARVCVPNKGLPPGQVVEMFGFDHDINAFVSLGQGTVGADGAQICSNPGFGITKSGWGGAVPPPPPKKCVGKTPPCQKCDTTTGTFVPDTAQDDQPCADAQQTQTKSGVSIKVADSCKGVCKAGSCGARTNGFSIDSAMKAAQSAVEKMFGACIGEPLKTTMQDCVKTKGFNVVCDENGTACATAAPGGNTLTLTPNAYKVADCDALNSSSLHEMVHACGNFRHRKCDDAGAVLGEIACSGQAGGCNVCVDPNTDKSYGCEAACYGAAGSSVGKAAACK